MEKVELKEERKSIEEESGVTKYFLFSFALD